MICWLSSFTSRNSRYAAFWICASALSLSASDRPGNWIKMWLPPAGWMTGSATPNCVHAFAQHLHRLRQRAGGVGVGDDIVGVAVGVVSSFVSISTRNDVPPCKSRPSLILPDASR